VAKKKTANKKKTVTKKKREGKKKSVVKKTSQNKKKALVKKKRQAKKKAVFKKKHTAKKVTNKKKHKKKGKPGKKAVPRKKHKTLHACTSSKSERQLHLDSLEGVTPSKIQYFIGSGHLVNGSPESHSQLAKCHVSEEVARCVYYYMALYFDSKNRLIEIRHYKKDAMLPDYEHSPQLQVTVDNGKHAYRKYELVQPYEFVPNKRGMNCIGGSPPPDLIVPKLSSGLVFQYLGFLNHLDPAFRLRHDLHLVYPLYIDFCMQVWIDYKNPLAPTVMNDIVLESVPFKAAPWPSKARHGGHIGVPNWIQDPEIPVCPKTNKPMELICQLGDGELSLTEKKNSIIGKKLNRTSNFGEFSSKENTKWISGDGDLFVFFSRKSRVACYLYQGT